MRSNLITQSYPYTIAHLWHVFNTLQLRGQDALDALNPMVDWLIENAPGRFLMSSGKLMTGIYNSTVTEVMVSNCIHFSDLEDVLAFRLRWGVNAHSHVATWSTF